MTVLFTVSMFCIVNGSHCHQAYVVNAHFTYMSSTSFCGNLSLTHRHIFNFDGAPSSSGCGRVFMTLCLFQALCSVSLSTLFTWTVWFWAPSTTRIICPALFTSDLAPSTIPTFHLRTVSTDQCWLGFSIQRCAGRARHPTLGESIGRFRCWLTFNFWLPSIYPLIPIYV